MADLRLKGESMVLLLFFLAYHVDVNHAQPATTFDISSYGANLDGNTDISQAVTSAWKEACATTSPSKVVIPKGTYPMNQVKLEGPCKAPLELNVQATLKAPPDPSHMTPGSEWITIQNIDLFTMSGGGVLDGQGGAAAWKQNDCHKNKNCNKLPNNLSLNFLTNSTIQDITTLDSKLFHVNILGCKNLTFLRFNVTAPGDSPNTDGIHIGRATGINIVDSSIGTGDDCISIGDGSEQINITGVSCGPGHGISVGSLGRSPGEQPVVGIFVKNCKIFNTSNGVRVKTWPASHPGVVTDLHFEDIIVDNVANPVIIDQQYCPWNQCTKEKPSLVKISKVSIRNITGTSATRVAVQLLCSKGVPCENVVIGDIELGYNGKEAGPITSSCANVNPNFVGKQNPPLCAASSTASPSQPSSSVL